MLIDHKKSFSQRKFLILMIALIVTVLIDTSVVKINDLIDKYLIPMQSKLILFSINSSLCLLLQFLIIKYLQSSIKRDQLNKTLKVQAFYKISLISLCLLGILIGILIFQQFYYNYYYTSISIFIIMISYGTAGGFIIWLSLLFFSWYKSNRNLIVFLYFISTLMIAFNLIITGVYTGVKMSERPELTGEYVGGSGDVSFGKHLFLGNVYRIFSFISFFSIWITTTVLMINYREKQSNAIVYWILLSIPLIYFLITYFYQYILGNILISYLEIDPISVSIMLIAFLALSKPIGGLVFGVAFWKISRIMSYERNIMTYMIISGFGIFLIFAANQAIVQIVSPYPSFGLSSITVLNIATFLMLLGIYNSAKLVSSNNRLRKLIHNNALESRLLDIIGKAEMEKEIQKTVKKIAQNKDILEKGKTEFELDEKGLKKYIDSVIRETKKEHK
ncbi:MAG TPA: hypothetical protein VFT83_03700 [Nitrososphaeraceae archaeon]|nr:hypothetical protein [Nitrososphaeraceae archaeon]